MSERPQLPWDITEGRHEFKRRGIPVRCDSEEELVRLARLFAYEADKAEKAALEIAKLIADDGYQFPLGVDPPRRAKIWLPSDVTKEEVQRLVEMLLCWIEDPALESKP